MKTEREPLQKGVYYCPECNKSFKTVKDLQKHIERAMATSAKQITSRRTF